MKSEIYSENPNFSIVLPGGCQASCKFCFYKSKETGKGWMGNLEYILDTLPECFNQISLTGGEPTVSPYLYDVLHCLKKRRDKYKKVVLSTNGYKLIENSSNILEMVDHVNLSRHHYEDVENRKIFVTQNVPSIKDVAEIAKIFKNKLTLNCVYKDMTPAFLFNYMRIAELAEIKNICLRREHGSLEKSQIENHISNIWTKTDEAHCPVCRSAFYRTSVGMNIGFKYSLLEPKEAIDGIYELVYNQDGKLTADWEGLEEVDLQKE